MTMTKQEKEAKAREMLSRNGYSEEQIKEILRYAFGDKKKSATPQGDND